MKPHEHVILEVARERERQVDVEGWNPEHDDYEHGDGSLALAAASYASPLPIYTQHVRASEIAFLERTPFGYSRQMKEKKARRRQLIIAAALVVAEIERLDRIAK